jgi:ArsR family transcriptional regulator
VTSERRGTWVHYRVRKDSLELLSGLLAVEQEARLRAA